MTNRLRLPELKIIISFHFNQRSGAPAFRFFFFLYVQLTGFVFLRSYRVGTKKKKKKNDCYYFKICVFNYTLISGFFFLDTALNGRAQSYYINCN